MIKSRLSLFMELFLKPALSGVFGLGMALASINSEAATCPYDVNDHIVMPDPGWSVDILVSVCGATDGGSMRIVATNKKENIEVELARFGIAASIDAKTEGNSLVITLPNMVDLMEVADSFGLYKVIYRFQPKDDPEQRNNYRFWLHHPQDPRAVEWFQSLISKNTR